MANNYFLGVADDVRQVTTSTASGTFATTNTAYAEINKVQVIVTLGSAYALADVVSALASAINAVSATSGTLGDETRNRGGKESGEFRDVYATSSGAVLTLTGEPGVPFVVAFGATGGTMGAASEDVAATGKNHLNAADNWSGSLTKGDTLVFQDSDVSLLYGLNNILENFALDVRSSYTGSFGLPSVNTTHSQHHYDEYRQESFDLPVEDSVGEIDHRIEGNVGTRRLNFGTNTPVSLTLTVLGSSNVVIHGGELLELEIHGGRITIGDDEAEAATEIKQLDIMQGSANVRCGIHTTFTNAADSIEVRGGALVLASDYNGSANRMLLRAGSVLVEDDINVKKLVIYAGRMDWRGAALAELYQYGGTFDASHCASSSYTSNYELYRGAKFYDPFGVIESPLMLLGCGIDDVELRLRDNIKLTIADAGAGAVPV